MKAQQVERIGYALTALVAAIVFIPIVLVILFIFIKGLPAISWQFLTEAPRNGMTEGGILPAILGTLLLTVGTAIAALPFGIGAAIYLAEYAPDNWLTRIWPEYHPLFTVSLASEPLSCSLTWALRFWPDH